MYGMTTNVRVYIFICCFSIVQGADWHWGPAASGNITDTSNGQPAYIRNSALATFVFAFVFLIMYLVFQVWCIIYVM